MNDEQLTQAYLATTYRVDAMHGPIDLRVGLQNEAIRDLHAAHGAASSVFVTACNPLSVSQQGAWNSEAMERLKRWLKVASRAFCTGRGIGDDPEWPPEESVLVLGATRTDAAQWCVRFEQMAVVFIPATGIPELVFHPERP